MSELLEFRKLPLFEVQARFTLAENLPISLPLVLDLRDAVHNDFPDISDLADFELAPGSTAQMIKVGPQAGGARFSNESTGMAFVVQMNLINVKWTRSSEPTGWRTYPRYLQALRPKLEMVVEAIEQLIGKGSVAVRVANMSYQNFIEAPAPVRASHLMDYLAIAKSSVLDRADLFHSLDLSFRDGDVDLRISAAASQDPAGPSGTGLVVATAGGLVIEPGAENPLECLDNVHDSLVKMFAGLLTERAIKEWEKQ